MIRLFRVFVPASVVFLLLSEIVLLFSAFILASYLVIEVDPEVFLLYDGGMMRIFLVVGSVLLGLYFQEMYSNLRIPSKVVLVQQIPAPLRPIGLAVLAGGLVAAGSCAAVWPRCPVRATSR